MDSISEVSCDADKLSESIAELDALINKEKKKYKRLCNDYYSDIIKDPEMFEEMTNDCAERKEILSVRREDLVKDFRKPPVLRVVLIICALQSVHLLAISINTDGITIAASQNTGFYFFRIMISY